MKKLVCGLVGIVVGAVGCATISIFPYNDSVSKLRQHYAAIADILGTDSGDSYTFVDAAKKGEPVSVIVDGKNDRKIIIFYDNDKDGNYETQTKLTIPHELDMKVLPPDPNYKGFSAPKRAPDRNKPLARYKKMA